MADSTKYLRLLQSLLPKGPAWNRDEDSGLTQFLYALADELARVEERSKELLVESDVRYSTELLIDHERDLSLPDECTPESQTIAERRLAAYGKLVSLGGQTPAYFIELAASYGYTITIDEDTGLGPFYWRVTIDIADPVIIYFTCGSSSCGDLLSAISETDELICIFNRYKPAHTSLLFDYDGPEYDRNFGPAFDALISSQSSYLDGEFGRDFGVDFDVAYGGSFDFVEFDTSFRRPA